MSKKSLVVVILFMLLFSAFSVNAKASERKNNLKLEDYEQIIEAFYMHKDCDIETDIYKYCSQQVEKLLKFKVELSRYKNEKLNIGYNDYVIDVIPVSMEEWNNSEMLFKVVRRWKYFIDSDTVSGESELIKIITDNNTSGEITEFYNVYEDISLGNIDELYRARLENGNDIEAFLQDYFDDFKKQVDYNAKIQLENEKEYKEKYKLEGDELEEDELEGDELEEDEKEYKLEIESDDSIFMGRAKKTLDRNAIKKWVRSNFNKDKPKAPKKSNIQYYDFSQISGAFDCTNFVSNALIAGGATMKKSGSSGIQGTDYWYYKDSGNRSSSWAGVNELYTFLTRSNPSSDNKGPYAKEKNLTYENAKIGDIVQGHNGSIWRHSANTPSFLFFLSLFPQFSYNHSLQGHLYPKNTV